MDIIFDQEANIRISSEKPEKLGDHSFPVDFFRREKRESIYEVEPKLPTEEAIGDITTSEIFVIYTILDEFLTESEILGFWMESHRKRGYGLRELYPRYMKYKAKIKIVERRNFSSFIFQREIICFVPRYPQINIPRARTKAQMRLYIPAMRIPENVPTNQKIANTLAMPLDSIGVSFRMNVFAK